MLAITGLGLLAVMLATAVAETRWRTRPPSARLRRVALALLPIVERGRARRLFVVLFAVLAVGWAVHSIVAAVASNGEIASTT